MHGKPVHSNSLMYGVVGWIVGVGVLSTFSSCVIFGHELFQIDKALQFVPHIPPGDLHCVSNGQGSPVHECMYTIGLVVGELVCIKGGGGMCGDMTCTSKFVSDVNRLVLLLALADFDDDLLPPILLWINIFALLDFDLLAFMLPFPDLV